MGRATQGVRLITLKGNDEIASVAKIEHEDEEVEDEGLIEGAESSTEPTAAENEGKPADDNNTDTEEETEEN